MSHTVKFSKLTRALIGTAALSAIALSASAQEQGRVISSTPIIQQVAVPRQVCGTQQVVVQQPKSGAGALMGAIAGGALGNSVGSGAGRALATGIGLLGGAIAGERIEGAAPAQVQNVQNCTTQTFYENRPTAYNVVYEFGGKQYNVQMPNDPGSFVQLQVTPVGAAQSAPAIPAPVIQPMMSAPAAVVAPQVVYQQPVAYPQTVVAPYPYYASYYHPSVYLGVGYWVGYRGGYRRWH